MVVAWLKYYSGICLEELKNTTKTSVRIVNVPVKIETEHLSNTNLKHYRQANLLIVKAREVVKQIS
jgi:hypothetical protein